MAISKDLVIYYSSLAAPHCISCACHRWDQNNYTITIETTLNKTNLTTLLNNITPGATGELYQILGRPLYYDKTWTGNNTLKLSPNSYAHSTLSKMRNETLIYPKNVTISSIGDTELMGVKIEGYISGAISFGGAVLPSGSPGNPYKIYDWEDLYNVRNDLDAYFILMANLDENTNGYDTYASDSANGGAGWEPIGGDNMFTGNFNGNNKTISDLYIDRDDEIDIGLFGYIGDCSIYNLGVLDVDITGDTYVGGLVAEGSGNVTITNCYTTGIIVSIGGYTGGLSGWFSGTITNCYSTCTVNGSSSYFGGLVGLVYDSTVTNCYATGDVTGDYWYNGGLLGYNQNSTTSYCYSTGDVIGEIGTGGFCGGTNSTISNCYSLGNVTRLAGVETNFGGFCGYNSGGTLNKCYSIGSIEWQSAPHPTDKGFLGLDNGTDTNCFWDTETSLQSTSSGDAVGKTTTQMKTLSTFTSAGWDMVAIGSYDDEDWYIDDGNDYPHLGWEL